MYRQQLEITYLTEFITGGCKWGEATNIVATLAVSACTLGIPYSSLVLTKKSESKLHFIFLLQEVSSVLIVISEERALI